MAYNGSMRRILHWIIFGFFALVAAPATWLCAADLGRFNRAEPGSWHSLPAAFCEVLGFAMHVSQASGGAYDPCAGALVNLWGFGNQGMIEKPPTDAQVNDMLQRVGYQRLDARQDPPALRKQVAGLEVDLSAIAKGWGVDELARLLEGLGVES